MLKLVQKQLKVRINDCKEIYREKPENKLQQNNIREVVRDGKRSSGETIRQF